MSFSNKSKSKYSSNNWNWWEHEQEDAYDDHVYRPTPVGSYNQYWKPKFDFSISLETRVKQLIKTITGKNLIVYQANGWGNDDKYFFYNPKDLKNATDDEILGRILHQLAKEMFIDKPVVIAKKNTELPYKHLISTLEDNRADVQLQARYAGCRYYAQELWHNRKLIDNPVMVNTSVKSVQDWFMEKHGLEWEEWVNLGTSYNAILDQERQYEDYVKTQADKQIDAVEFNFNIQALQNGETDFDFTKEPILENFKKAIPAIQGYLAATSFVDAQVFYPEIQRYYPVPNQKQQQEMERQVSGMAGLGDKELTRLSQELAQEAALKAAGVDASKLLGIGAGFGNSNRTIVKNLAEYQRIVTQSQGMISTLHALIRSILKDNSIKRYQRPFKRGKIDAKRMYKYLSVDDLRIFKKPRIISERKYTMAIVVDTSGSMGHLADYALQGAIILIEVFEKLGLPYEVLGFSDDTYVIKKFGDGLRRELVPALHAYYSGNGTDDYKALNLLEEHMKGFDPNSTYHKGIFIVTDGGSARPNEMADLVKKVESEHNASVFGIGIGNVSDEMLAPIYSHRLAIDNISELPKALVGIMRSQFRRG